MFLMRLTGLMTICFLSLTAQGSNALRGKKFFGSTQTSRKEMNIQREFVKQTRKPAITKSDIAAIIPTDIQTTNDGRQVFDKILARAASSIGQSKLVQNNFLMKTAKKIEQTAAMDLEVEGEPTISGDQPTDHKFKFDIQAFKGEARLLYTGYVDSKIEYSAAQDEFEFSIEETLSENSKIALSHQKNRFEQRQILQYQITW